MAVYEKYWNKPMDIFQEIKSEVSIIQACSTYGIRVSHNNTSLCPFHKEKTASFRIYPDTNSYYCFGCGAGGDVINLVQGLYGLSPLDAAYKIKQDFRLNIQDQRKLDMKFKPVRHFSDLDLAQKYKEWEKKYLHYLSENMKLLDQLIVLSNPSVSGGIFTTDFAYAVHKKELLEYQWNTIVYGNLKEIISLYISISGVVKDWAG